MIDYNSDVLPLEQGGMDDAAIASFLSAKTMFDMPASELENLLGRESLAKRNAITGAWEGVLIDTMNEGGEIGEGLEELFSHLNKPRSVSIETSKSPWAEKASLLISGLFVSSKLSESQISGIYFIAGGKQFPNGVTQEDIAAARKKLQDEESALAAERAVYEANMQRTQAIEALASEIYNNYINPAISGTSTADELRASIKQGL